MSLILDGTDNFETRYLINDYAVDSSLPWIYSAAVGSYAVTLNILPGQTACLACIFPDSPRGMVETCETSGILNSAVNLVASIAATEALKMIVEAASGAKARVEGPSAIAALKRDATQRHSETTTCGALCFRLMCGPTNTRKSPPRNLAPAAVPAGSATSFILPAKAVRTSRCVAGIPCKSMSANAPSTSPRWTADFSLTASSGTTISS